jgi:hypothetical protein
MIPPDTPKSNEQMWALLGLPRRWPRRLSASVGRIVGASKLI